MCQNPTNETPMFLIVGTVRVPAGSLDKARPAMRAMIAGSRSEQGCVEYSYSEDVLEPGLIHVKEVWESREAISAHFNSGHMKAWRSAWPELKISDRNLVLCEIMDQEPI
jgi:quinol monooxygenase YgiN